MILCVESGLCFCEKGDETVRKRQRRLAAVLAMSMIATCMQGMDIQVSAEVTEEVEQPVETGEAAVETTTPAAVGSGSAIETPSPAPTVAPIGEKQSSWKDIAKKIPQTAEYYYRQGEKTGEWLTLPVAKPCGANTWWYYDETEEKIVFTGKGDMDWYSVDDNQAPETYALVQEGKTIKHATVTDGVTELGNDMLYGMDQLEDVVIADSVTDLENAFEGCTGLKNVTIGKNVKSIDAGIFKDCENLEEIFVSPDNPYFCVENNMLLNKDKTRLILAWGEKCEIPRTVLKIDENAFISNKTEKIIADIRNPEYSTENGVLYSKDKSTMYRCPKGRTGAINAPDSVTAVSAAALGGCEKVEEVSFGEKIDTDGQKEDLCNVLAECTALKEINVAEGHPYYSTKDGVLYNREASKLLAVPKGMTGAYTMPETVLVVRSDAFVGCGQITGVSVNNQIEDVLDFTGCKQLSDIEIASGNPAFFAEDGLVYNKAGDVLYFCVPGKKGTCTIPDTVKEVKENCFVDCGEITVLKLNGAVLVSNLEDCEKLEQIELGSKVPDNKDLWESFRGKKLSSIVVDEVNEAYSSEDGILYNKAKTELIACPSGKTGEILVAETVTSIRDYAFNGCTNIDEVDFSEKVTSIGKNAFEDCTGIKEFVLPSTLKKIGDGAFDGCSNLTKINIPKGVSSIGWTLFRRCGKLSTVKVASSHTKYTSVSGIVYNKKKTKVVFCGEGKSGKISLPSTVTTIGNSAFSYCTKITSVTFPKKLTKIEAAAFWGCSGIKSFSFPSKLKTIGSGAFNACYKLEKVTFPTTLVDLGSMAFVSCYRLASVTITKNVDVIEEATFQECTALSKVTIKGTALTKVGTGAFSYCPSLTEVSLPSSVKTISSYAFSSCTKLKKINVPAKVTKISEGVFSQCIALPSLTVPSKVTTLGKSCFDGCSALKKVKINGKVLNTVKAYAFRGMPDKAVFTVPKSKKSAYQKLFKSKASYGFKSTMTFKTF